MRGKDITKEPIHFYKEQFFECTGCGRCCRLWDVPVTNYEKKRIEKLKFSAIVPSHTSYFIKEKKRKLFIIRKQDGKCVFLDKDNLCLIHKEHGEEYKPLACRLYPFDIFLWDDNSASLALRFDCPSAVGGKGKKIEQYEKFLRKIIREITGTSPKFSACYNERITSDTSSIRFITSAFRNFLLSERFSLSVRIFAAARFLEFYKNNENRGDLEECRPSFPDEMFQVVENSRESLQFAIDTSEGLNINERILFRYLISGYARVDEEKISGWLPFSRLTRCKNILDFSLGRGSLSCLSSQYPDTYGIDPIGVCEDISWKDNVYPVLKMFMASKLYSMHFCGIPLLKSTFENGMKHFLLSIPVLTTISALIAKAKKKEEVTREDMEKAIMIVDHTFSRSPFFKLNHIKRAENKLSSYKILPAILKNFPSLI